MRVPRGVHGSCGHCSHFGLNSLWVVHGGLTPRWDHILFKQLVVCQMSLMVSRFLQRRRHRSGKPWLSGPSSSPQGLRLRERTQERVVEQDVLPLKEEIAEVMSFTPLKRGVEQATVPHLVEDTVEVHLAPKETTDCRAGVPQLQEETVEVAGRSRTHDCNSGLSMCQ